MDTKQRSRPIAKPIIGDPMSDEAVYLGDGVWWQLTQRQVASGLGRFLPRRIRPW